MNEILIDHRLFQPIGHNILVSIARAQKEEKKTESGIILVNNSSVMERETKGTVIRVGDEVTRVKPGDTVYFELQAGIDAKSDEFKLVVIRENSVIGLTRPKDPETVLEQFK